MLHCTLLVWHSYCFDQIHVACVTVHLQPPEDEVCGDGVEGKEEEEDEVIPSTPIPKEWDCLGSDLEIKEGFMEPGRPLVCVGFHIDSACNNCFRCKDMGTSGFKLSDNIRSGINQ